MVPPDHATGPWHEPRDEKHYHRNDSSVYVYNCCAIHLLTSITQTHAQKLTSWKADMPYVQQLMYFAVPRVFSNTSRLVQDNVRHWSMRLSHSRLDDPLCIAPKF